MTTTPRDAIAGLSERLRERAATRNTPRRVSDRDYETMGYYTATSAETDREAAAQLDALTAKVKELTANASAERGLRMAMARDRSDEMKHWKERATRAEQERDEAYERAAAEAEWEGYSTAGRTIAAAIRQIASALVQNEPPNKEK